MSEMLDNIFTKNFLNLALEEAFLPKASQLKGPGPRRLNRSASFFSPPSPPSPRSHSLSAERADDHADGGDDDNNNDGDDNNDGPFWSSNIWSQGPVSKPKPPAFRPDRSMSLTEGAGGLLLSSAFPSAATVAPPPGFPASSALPPQVQPPVAPNRYKTELCRGFQETGSCKYGTKCQFAHGEEELRGLFRHPKYKTEPCRTFYNFGYCPYGSRCHFIHEDKSSGSPLSTAKFRDQQPPPGAQNPRHPLRQSVSFGGFLGSSRRSPPPSFLQSFNDPNLGFSRAHSVSPPPADLLSPVFGGGGGGGGDSLQAAAAAFHFGNHQTRASAGDLRSAPVPTEPQKASHCVCGHGNNFNGGGGADGGGGGGGGGGVVAFPGAGAHRGFPKPAGLQRFSSEDSLEDSYSSSSGGSSGTESPTFDAATKRLTVFERLSLSD